MFTVCTLTKCTAEFNGTTTGTALALRFYQISPTACGANSPFTCVAVPCLKTCERPRPAAEFQKIIDNLWISSSRTRFCSAGGSTEYAWAATRIARFTRAASHNQLDKPVGFSPDSYPLLWFWIWNRCRVCRTVTKMPSRLASAELFWSK